jgi:hypothetical protein
MHVVAGLFSLHALLSVCGWAMATGMAIYHLHLIKGDRALSFLLIGLCVVVGIGTWIESAREYGTTISIQRGIDHIQNTLNNPPNNPDQILAAAAEKLVQQGKQIETLQSDVNNFIAQQSDRPMETEAFDKLISTFRPAANALGSLQVEAVSASPNAPGYAQIFMYAFHKAGMAVNGIGADDSTSLLYPSQATVSSPRMKGLFIGVQNYLSPPEMAVRFHELLKAAGFDAVFTNWQAVTDPTYVFVVSYK